jgi:protein-disulfide isomerase
MGPPSGSRRVSHPRHRRIAAALALAVCVLLPACSKDSSSSPTAPTSTLSNVQLPALDVMLADKTLGNASAPLTMIEYSSLTCPHCADFHASTLPQITAAYIDPGKVKLIYRDFPLDNAAISAAMVARCSGDRFFTVLDRLYQTQSTWAAASNTTAGLKTAVAPIGVTAAEVDACLAITDLRNGILNMRTGGQSQYAVSGTPTFIIGGQTLVGAWPFANFDSLLKSLLP